MAMRRVWLWLAMACAILVAGQGMIRAAAPKTRMAVITRLRRGQWPVIDGRFGDPAWQGVRPLQAFVPLGGDGAKPKPETVAWVTYDDARLYLFIRCREPRPEEMRVAGEGRDDDVGEGDSLHLFIATADLPDPSFYFALNPKNVRWDAFCNGETIEPAIDCEWESAVVAGKKEWCAEIAIPWSALRREPPLPGTKIRANLGRRRVPDDERTTWSPAQEQFHEPERFGTWVLQ